MPTGRIGAWYNSALGPLRHGKLDEFHLILVQVCAVAENKGLGFQFAEYVSYPAHLILLMVEIALRF